MKKKKFDKYKEMDKIMFYLFIFIVAFFLGGLVVNITNEVIPNKNIVPQEVCDNFSKDIKEPVSFEVYNNTIGNFKYPIYGKEMICVNRDCEYFLFKYETVCHKEEKVCEEDEICLKKKADCLNFGLPCGKDIKCTKICNIKFIEVENE